MNSGKPMACVGYGVGYEVSASYNPLISHDKHGIYLRANSTKAWTRQGQHSQTGADRDRGAGGSGLGPLYL